MWIEIWPIWERRGFQTSRPARALWIEIVRQPSAGTGTFVEAREGLVD